MNFSDILLEDSPWPKEQKIQFWDGSRTFFPHPTPTDFWNFVSIQLTESEHKYFEI